MRIGSEIRAAVRETAAPELAAFTVGVLVGAELVVWAARRMMDWLWRP